MIDLGQVVPTGTTYSISWRRKGTYGTAGTADMIVEESLDNSNWSANSTIPNTTSQTTFVSSDLTAENDTRYVRVSPATNTGDDFDFDAITSTIMGNCVEVCNNGTDDDGDGDVDCDDEECPCTPPAPTTCEDADGDGMLTVCRRTSENDQGTTQTVSVSDWATTEGTYDYCGPCADYITVANGAWNSNGTWKNGNKPPFSISGKEVRITHDVTVASNNVTIDNAAHLSVDGGSLILLGDQLDITVRNGTLNVSNGATAVVGDDLKMNNTTSKVIVASNGTIDVKKRFAFSRGTMTLVNGTLKVAAALGMSQNLSDEPDGDKGVHIQNGEATLTASHSNLIIGHTLLIDAGTIELEASCVTTELHWRNKSGTAIINNSKLDIEGSLINDNNSTTNFNNSYVYLSDKNPFDFGNVESTGTVTGQLNALYLPYGFSDVQNWNATITNACIAETSGNDINTNNNCSHNFVAEFGEVACFEVQEPTGPTVTLLNNTNVHGKGTNVLKKNDFNIPAGSNRQMIVVGFFERNHCGNCPSGTNYSGLGDSYANGSNTNDESVHTIDFRVAGPGTTTIKQNQTNDSFGNYHSARNMVWRTQNTNNWQTELEHYHKALYSNEVYFTVYNESEINALLGGANSGNVTIDFDNINAPSHNADDAFLQVYVFENVAQNENGVALTGKLDEGHEFLPVDHIYQLSDLQDGYEADELTDGVLVIGYAPIKGDFKVMPDYGVVVNNRNQISNDAAGSTQHGEADAISASTQFRRGPKTGIINSVTLQQEGINPSNVNPFGSIVLVFTLESF